MRFIYLLLFLILGIWYTCPIPYTDLNTPVQPPSSPDLSVQLVQDSRDTINNSYSPPLRYMEEEKYQQMGYLKRNQRIPLFGKPAHLRRDKWYYYTIIDGIKLPLVVNKRKSSIAPGIDSLSSGDKVYVDHDEYIVHLYEIDIY